MCDSVVVLRSSSVRVCGWLRVDVCVCVVSEGCCLEAAGGCQECGAREFRCVLRKGLLGGTYRPNFSWLRVTSHVARAGAAAAAALGSQTRQNACGACVRARDKLLSRHVFACRAKNRKAPRLKGPNVMCDFAYFLEVSGV